MNFSKQNTLTATQRKHFGTQPYVARKREPHEALPPQISLMKLPVYKPARDLDQRSGIARV